MRKKTIILSVCILILFVIPLFIYFMKDNPNLMKNQLPKEKLSNFYEVYSKGMDGTSQFMKNNNAGILANYRFYYGDIIGFKIEKIKEVDSLHKEAEVKVNVKVENKPKSYIDVITLELIDNNWLISNYSSSSKAAWPKLP